MCALFSVQELRNRGCNAVTVSLLGMGVILDELAATYIVYYLGWLQESQFDKGPPAQPPSPGELGPSSKILKLFCVAYIQSKIEYAFVMFTGVVTPLKHKLKVIQNICLRLMLLARNTSLFLFDPWRLRLILPHLILARTLDFLLAKLFCKLCYRAIGQPIIRLLNCFKLNLDLMPLAPFTFGSCLPGTEQVWKKYSYLHD